jgi:hypothetical protein
MVDGPAATARRLQEFLASLEPGQLFGIETGPSGAPTGSFYAVTIEDPTLVPLGNGYAVPHRFHVDRDDVTIYVTYRDGERTTDVFHRNAGTALLRHLRLTDLVDQAAAHVVHTTDDEPVRVFEATGDGWTSYDDTIPAGTRLLKSDEIREIVRTPRRRISDDDLQHAATAYRRGGIEAVKTELFRSESQAWRYVKKAQDAGLLEPARRKKAGT